MESMDNLYPRCWVSWASFKKNIMRENKLFQKSKMLVEVILNFNSKHQKTSKHRSH